MRDLSISEKNVLTINDGRSGSGIELHYRNPTTEEEAAYQIKMVRRQGKKVILNLHPTRVEFGLKILTGFRAGDFGFEGKPVSPDPASENYREDWKDLVKAGASDIIAILGRTVFEGATVESDVEIEDLTDEVIEEAVPLEKSSKSS